MIKIPKYNKKDFKRVTWEEYGKTLEILYQKVSKYLKENKIKIDIVVPILRGGAFPGMYLAYKFHILPILPVQYKYFFSKGKLELRKHSDYPKITIEIPKNPVFLLAEGNHCFGTTAQTAADDLKKTFPGCKIIYAADQVDYSYQKIQNVEAIFYGKLTNECRGLTKKEAEEKGISNDLSLFPWEDLEEEWITVSCKQFDYGCKPTGEKKMEAEVEK